MERALVTGAGGFIGGHLVQRLERDGVEVRGVDVKPLDDWYQIGAGEHLVLDVSLGGYVPPDALDRQGTKLSSHTPSLE